MSEQPQENEEMYAPPTESRPRRGQQVHERRHGDQERLDGDLNPLGRDQDPVGRNQDPVGRD
jgi:hypothetical protein